MPTVGQSTWHGLPRAHRWPSWHSIGTTTERSMMARSYSATTPRRQVAQLRPPAEKMASIGTGEGAGISVTDHGTGRRDGSGNTFRYESTVWMSGIGKRAVPRPVYDIFFASVP